MSGGTLPTLLCRCGKHHVCARCMATRSKDVLLRSSATPPVRGYMSTLELDRAARQREMDALALAQAFALGRHAERSAASTASKSRGED